MSTSFQRFVLAILAGAFIGFGGLLYSVAVTTGDAETAFGVRRLIGGLAFSVGLILVIVGGAELFTGNNLIVMAWANRRITSTKLIYNWVIVYVGNFMGAIGVALLCNFSDVASLDDGAVGATMLAIAANKCQLNWITAFAAGIGCNVLVCLAVWLCLSARSVTDKVFCILFPITAFVATGMEHCVANMYFIPVAMLVQTTIDTGDTISMGGFIGGNLLPVTLGNIVGGAGLVGMVYWFVYLRNQTPEFLSTRRPWAAVASSFPKNQLCEMQNDATKYAGRPTTPKCFPQSRSRN